MAEGVKMIASALPDNVTVTVGCAVYIDYGKRVFLCVGCGRRFLSDAELYDHCQTTNSHVPYRDGLNYTYGSGFGH
jgi:hypothetical protein